jgi:hypothetical protein
LFLEIGRLLLTREEQVGHTRSVSHANPTTSEFTTAAPAPNYNPNGLGS